jgi:tetratricopeptide (TPR) repeat protein
MSRFPSRTTALALALAAMTVLAGCKSQTPDEMFLEAGRLLEERKTSQAVLKLKDIVRDHAADPVAADAHLLLARYYASEGNGARAVEELQTVYKNFPFADQRVQEAIGGIIDLRLQMQDFEGALAMADEAIGRSEEVAPAVTESRRSQKASVLATIGGDENAAAAVAILRDLMLTATDTGLRGESREALAQYHRQAGDFAASNAIYTDYLAKFPDDPIRDQLHLAMALNHKAMGEEGEAAKLFDETATRLRAAAEAELDKVARAQRLAEIAVYHEMYGDADTAEEILRQVMAENVGSRVAIDAQFSIARMHAVGGRIDKAREVLEAIQRENPGTNIEATAKSYLEQIEQASAAEAEAAAAGDAAEVLPAGS